MAALLIAATGCSDADTGAEDSPSSPASATDHSYVALTGLPRGVSLDDLDPDLLQTYEQGQMPVDDACRYTRPTIAQAYAIGALVEDPDLGEAFTDLADAKQRNQARGGTPEEYLDAFDDITEAGADIDEVC